MLNDSKSKTYAFIWQNGKKTYGIGLGEEIAPTLYRGGIPAIAHVERRDKDEDTADIE